MRRKKGRFTRFVGAMFRLVFTLVIAGVAMVGLSSCAQKDVAEFADRQPALMLEQFFVGQSVAYGIFEDRFGNVRRQFRVNLDGRLDGNDLILDEDFLYDDGERAKRIWTIANNGKNEAGLYQYQGRADDITGTASGIVMFLHFFAAAAASLFLSTLYDGTFLPMIEIVFVLSILALASGFFANAARRRRVTNMAE